MPLVVHVPRQINVQRDDVPRWKPLIVSAAHWLCIFSFGPSVGQLHEVADQLPASSLEATQLLIPIVVGGECVMAVVDTGAARSCAPSSFARMSPLMTDTIVRLASCTGENLPVQGEGTLHFSVPSLRREYDFTFVFGDVTRILLGMDFLEKVNWVVDCGSRKICDTLTSLYAVAQASSDSKLNFSTTQTSLPKSYPSCVHTKPVPRSEKSLYPTSLTLSLRAILLSPAPVVWPATSWRLRRPQLTNS